MTRRNRDNKRTLALLGSFNTYSGRLANWNSEEGFAALMECDAGDIVSWPFHRFLKIEPWLPV